MGVEINGEWFSFWRPTPPVQVGSITHRVMPICAVVVGQGENSTMHLMPPEAGEGEV